MTKREVVKTALAFKKPPYVPWSFGFTHEAQEKLVAHYGTDDLDPSFRTISSNWAATSAFSRTWATTAWRTFLASSGTARIDKDIGNVEGQCSPNPPCAGYALPRSRCDPPFLRRHPRETGPPPRPVPLFLRRVLALRAGLDAARHGEPAAWISAIIPGSSTNCCAPSPTTTSPKSARRSSYDIDAVYFGDDWGQQRGLLMGYRTWKEFIFPVLQAHVRRRCSEAGKIGHHPLLRRRGRTLRRSDRRSACDCFNPFQPEVMDVDALMNAYRGRLGFWGGLSTQRHAALGMRRACPTGNTTPYRRAAKAAISFPLPMRWKAMCRWKTCWRLST